MNRFTQRALNFLRRHYLRAFGPDPKPLVRSDNAEEISRVIYDRLMDDKPFMLTRFGSVELRCTYTYLGMEAGASSWLSYVRGKSPAFWFEPHDIETMRTNAGFFSNTPEQLRRFGKRYYEDSALIDVLGVWGPVEYDVADHIKDSFKANIVYLEPYFSSQPWTRALAGKKVLVVHPFASLIEQQYRNHRTQLFADPNVLPEFELHTIQAVQSLGGDSNGFATWFDALKWMEDAIDQVDYDICIIGCGAYGLPLAGHVKRMGKKAIHLGGATQLLFGIKGNRWENPVYGLNEPGFPPGFYLNMFNEHWIRPGENERPKSAEKVENACYW